MRYRKFVAGLVLSFATVGALAQIGPPGGGGGYDSNPTNPANWQVTYSVVSGEDRLQRWEWDNSSQVYTLHLYTRAWGSTLWYRDGVPWSNAGLTLPVANDNNYEGQTSMTSVGTVRAIFQWVSPYPKPTEVAVVVSAQSYSVRGHYPGNPGELAADDGLGDEPVLEEPYFGLNLTSSGKHLRRLAVDSGGTATFELHKSASATESGYMAASGADAHGISAAIDDRTVFVYPLAGRTFTERQLTGGTLVDHFGFSYPTAVPAAVVWTYPQMYSSEIHLHLGVRPRSVLAPSVSWLRQNQFIGSATWKGGPATYVYDAAVGQGWNGFWYTGPIHDEGTLVTGGPSSPPNVLASYRGAVEQEDFWTSYTIGFLQNDDTLIEEFLLRYTWPDSTVGLSRALVQFHHETDGYTLYGVLNEPKEKIDKPGIENQDPVWLTYNEWVSPQWVYRQPSSSYDLGGSWSGWVSQASDSYESSAPDVLHFWYTLGQLGSGWVAFLATVYEMPPLALVATAAGLVWLTADLATPEATIISISRTPDLFLKACYLGGDWIYPLPPNWPDPAYFPPASSMTQYNWQAYHRTLHKRLRKYFDIWDDAGFVARDLAEDSPPFDYDSRQKFKQAFIGP